MLDDALEGRLEMGIFADGFGGGEETPEETGLVAPLCLRVVDDEPVSPRTVPAGFERGWFLSLGDETPESTESESPDSEIFARQASLYQRYLRPITKSGTSTRVILDENLHKYASLLTAATPLHICS
ncbi:hypothetical protein OOU_Y34scaffold00261g10 [Pyricularia oryzae Y34]|uniref:Uncharacterized protein n=1 Tax=Pyricularia oryzae (strain Y34) TaxID=1143189 RepID=A0AA97P415_PYRO3|nr:hypothetical protein OOU_Y34scaffold00261g10 [Pyricularia oryzae Y34]